MVICVTLSHPPTFGRPPIKAGPAGSGPSLPGHSFLQFLLMTKYALLQSLVRPMICNACSSSTLFTLETTLITTYLIPADFSKYQLNHWLGNRGAAHVQLSNFPMLLRHNLHRLNLLCIFFCPKGVICLQAAQSLLGKDRFWQICAHPTCRCCWRRTPPPPPPPLPPTPPVAAERNPSAKPRLLSAS